MNIPATIPTTMRLVVAAAATALLGLTGAAIAPSASADPADEFTACMRANGLPEFPTGTVTDDGRLLLNSGAAHLDPFSPAYRSAAAACADRLPAGTVLPAEPAPPQPPTAPVPVSPELPAAPVPGSPQPPAVPAL